MADIYNEWGEICVGFYAVYVDIIGGVYNTTLGTTRTAVGTSSPLFVQDLSSGADHKCYIITKLDNDSSLTSTSYSLPITTNTVSISYTDISATPIYTALNTTSSFTSYTKTVSGATGSYLYSNGTYDVSSSSFFDATTNWVAYNIFNIYTTYGWLSASGKYSGAYPSSTSAYTITSSLTTICGEWVQIKLPYKLKLKYYRIKNSSFSVSPIKEFTAVASNDGSSWTTITSGTNPSSSADVETTFSVSTSQTYYYFRFIITQSYTNTQYATSIGRLTLIGDTP